MILSRQRPLSTEFQRQCKIAHRLFQHKRFFTFSFAVVLCLHCTLPAHSSEPAVPAGQFEVSAQEIRYIAVKGDTLIALAQYFTGNPNNWAAIGKLNKIGNDRRIPVGSMIRIPAEYFPDEASEARVVALAGPANVVTKAAAARPLNIGDTLQEGDRISTGKNGFLSLALADQSRVSIPSNSRVALAVLRKQKYTQSPRTEIRLIDGRVESKVTPLNDNKGRFEVTSPLAIAGVRGTHFRVALGDANTALEEDAKPTSRIARVANEVLEGSVAISKEASKEVNKQGNKNALILSSGNGNIVDAKNIGKAALLLPPPQLQGAFQLQEKPSCQFTLMPAPKAARYRMQISTDSAAQNILQEALSKDGRFKFEGLDDNDYFLRATAIDEMGLEGLPTTVAFKLKARPEPPFSVQPKKKHRGNGVEFVWTEASQAQASRLQVARDLEFKDIVLDQSPIQGISFTIAELKPGHYFWRVASIANKQGQADQGPFGDAQALHLLPPQSLGALADTGGNMLNFAWPSEPGQGFLIQIARDAAFANLFLNQELTQAELSIARPAAGVYYIRVRATDPDGYVGAFSGTQKLTIHTRWVNAYGDPVESSSGNVRTNF
jgi:hypothetical protein